MASLREENLIYKTISQFYVRIRDTRLLCVKQAVEKVSK